MDKTPIEAFRAKHERQVRELFSQELQDETLRSKIRQYKSYTVAVAQFTEQVSQSTWVLLC